MAYSELVKDIGKIRSFIRDFYVFGFYSREEYAALYQISPRSYDNERRRIESWMQEYLRFYQNSSGKKVFLSVDGSSILHNPLYRAFKAKSFTANDALLHFCLMDLFSDGQVIDQPQIEELLWDRYADMFSDKGLPDMKTIRLKLEDLTRLGLLKKTKKGRSVRYRIASDSIDLTLSGIWDALSFFSEGAPMGVIGSFLLDKNPDRSDCPQFFRFRHHYLMQAIDSEILCELLLAIDEKRRIRMRVDSAFQGSLQHLALPLKIFVSTETGREYLLSWSEETARFYFTRLDRIVWVNQLEVSSSWDRMAELFHRQKHQLWGVSFGSLKEVCPPVHFEMEISVGESEDHIVRRLEREKRGGTVVRLEPHGIGDAGTVNRNDTAAEKKERYLFSVDVYDAEELLPWICTFTGRILRLQCDDDAAVLKYRDYLTQMAEYYQLPDKTRESPDQAADMNALPADGALLSGTGPASGFRPLLKSGTDSLRFSGSGPGIPAAGRHDLVFHEVYGAYYNALSRILSLAVRRELTPAKLYDAVRDNAFSESGMHLPDRLLTGEWGFLNENLETCLGREPAMPLTLIQKRWLKSLMEDPRIRLFLDSEAYDALSEQLKEIRPLYACDTFCWFDRFTDGDTFSDPVYIRHFRTVLSALREQKMLFLIYRNRFGNAREMQVIPQYIEYSGREDKFRLYAGDPGAVEPDEPLRLNISRILECRLLDESIPFVTKVKTRRETVVMELVDGENTLERAMFHFSFLEKKTERLENGRFRITLYYAKADETEILIRILSFGHQLHVISEGYIREELTARLASQRCIFHSHPA